MHWIRQFNPPLFPVPFALVRIFGVSLFSPLPFSLLSRQVPLPQPSAPLNGKKSSQEPRSNISKCVDHHCQYFVIRGAESSVWLLWRPHSSTIRYFPRSTSRQLH